MFSSDNDISVPSVDRFYTGSWERRGRSPNSSAFFGLMLIGLIYTFGQLLLMLGFVALVLASHIGEASPEALGRELLGSMRGGVLFVLALTQYGLMLLPTVLLVRRWHTFHVREYLRLTRFPIIEIVLAVLIVIALMPTGSFVAELIQRGLGIPDQFTSIGQELFTASTPREFLWLSFVIGVTPAICEETFFRGYVQRTFERRLGWKSVIVTGVFFGLFHMQPVGLFTLALIGVVLGYFYYRSKSLFPSMAAHFTNNFIAVWSLYSGAKLGGVNLADDQGVPLSWVAITLPIALLLLLAYHAVTRGRIDPIEEETKLIDDTPEGGSAASPAPSEDASEEDVR